MRRALNILLVVAVLCVSIAATARAAGINLYWNDCSAGGAATTNRDFACNTNVGFNDLYVSYDPPPEITSVVGVEIIINVRSSASGLQDWWQFKNPGTCRVTALTMLPSAVSDCLDPWQGVGVGGIAAYQISSTPGIPPNGARILAVMAVAEGTPMVPLVAGTEYFGGVIRISNARTVGPAACAGCTIPVCLMLSQVSLYPPGAASGTPLLLPLTNQFVGWQGGIGGVGGGFTCFGPTPTLNRTWGQIKTLYR